MPILILPVSLLCRSNVPVRHRLDRTSFRGRRLFQPIPAACKSSIQEAFCRTLVKLFLIGSAVSVATFWASSQSSLFCAEAALKFFGLCVADTSMVSHSDFG